MEEGEMWGSILEILAEKARQGVDVRIVTPGVPDKWYVYAVTRANYPALAMAVKSITLSSDSK